MWNHNSHYHDHLLTQLPPQIDRALDIGCGLGVFALKLASKAQIIDAVDTEAKIIQEALRIHDAPNIRYQCVDFIHAELPQNSYDAIVSIASLHHMDLEIALTKIRTLLRPSGKLLILGLYKETTVTDYLYSAVSVPLNYIYLKRDRKNSSTTQKAPTQNATLSLEQIKSIANSIIPSNKIQRHLFWRYSLIWKKPIS